MSGEDAQTERLGPTLARELALPDGRRLFGVVEAAEPTDTLRDALKLAPWRCAVVTPRKVSDALDMLDVEPPANSVLDVTSAAEAFLVRAHTALSKSVVVLAQFDQQPHAVVEVIARLALSSPDICIVLTSSDAAQLERWPTTGDEIVELAIGSQLDADVAYAMGARACAAVGPATTEIARSAKACARLELGQPESAFEGLTTASLRTFAWRALAALSTGDPEAATEALQRVATSLSGVTAEEITAASEPLAKLAESVVMVGGANGVGWSNAVLQRVSAALAESSAEFAIIRGRISAASAFVALVEGQPVEAIARFQSAIQWFEKGDALWRRLSTQLDLGHVLAQLGDYPAARTTVDSAMSDVARVPDARLASIAHYQAADLAWRRDDANAVALTRRALALAERASIAALHGENLDRIVAGAEGLLARLLARSPYPDGDPAALANRCRQRLEGTPLAPLALAIAADVALQSGKRGHRADIDSAVQLAASAVEALDAMPNGIEEGEGFIRLTLIEALDAAEMPNERDAAAEHAVERLRTRAERLPEGATRQRFEAIREHAATLAWAPQ